MSDFKFKTYRCEWVAEIYTVDQYDMREKESEVWVDVPFPTREEAAEYLEAITNADQYVAGRRVYPHARHSYYACGVRYREVEVKE